MSEPHTGDSVPDPAPFPMGSVQAVAARTWSMCVREDPLGLLAIPYLIAFPVYAFLTILSELIRQPDTLTREPTIAGAVVGVLPLVLFARVFAEAWTLTRADAEAHGRRVPYAESVRSAFSRTWALAVVMVVVYVLFQAGLVLFVIPGMLVAIVASFANQAATIGPGHLVESLKESKDLLEHNARAWCGMVAYWLVLFLGLGMVVTIARYSVEKIAGGPLGFALDLALFLPLHVALLVFTACWTLFYRELQARRRAQLALAATAHVEAAARHEPSIPDFHAHAG